jgi:hypothetical protein
MAVLLSDGGTAALDQDDVAPAAVAVAEGFVGAGDAQDNGRGERGSRGSWGNGPDLDGLDAGSFCGLDERVEQGAGYALVAGLRVDVGGVFDDPGVRGSVGHRATRGGQSLSGEAR